jgi:hypothetical protein
MLDNKLNNKCLFKNEKKTNDAKIKIDKNIVDHGDCILQMEKLYMKLQNKDNDYNILYKNHLEENILLKKQNKKLKILLNNKDFINDDLMYIDYDLFEYESDYILEKKVISYGRQLDYINTFLNYNNVSNFEELSKIISYNNNTDLNIKYDNIFTILNNSEMEIKSQKLKINELFNDHKNIEYRINIIKNKIDKLSIGTIITINGIKKIYRGKIENTIDKIKSMEQEYEEYCSQQISWAKSIIGNDFEDEKIVKILDIFNKIKGNYNYNSSSSDINENSEIYKRYNNRYNNIKIKKMEEFNLYCDFGKDFINDGINTKKDIPKELLEIIKDVIKSSDISYGKNDEKINRFISSCKRYYILSQKNENHDNIIRSKCKTSIRDMNNKDFDNLLKLIENINKKE